ncbi:NAD-dependent epimerase/dehydratase family protein [Bacillus sp. JJ1562]|uniref:NAD-dependent epimerase/dehydratase family protein n=1 Tax=Bacillus sp. JJ1562 TaxID=3122960 RepID=UPI0030023AAA
MEKVLILGASGLVGRALIDEFKDEFDIYGTYSSSLTSLSDGKQFQLEVQHIDKMRQLIRSIKPDVVISCLRGNFDHQFQFHKELAMELRNSSSRLYFFSIGNSEVPLTLEEGNVKSSHSQVYPIFFSKNIENTYEILKEKSVIVSELQNDGMNKFFDLYDFDGNKLQVCYWE